MPLPAAFMSKILRVLCLGCTFLVAAAAFAQGTSVNRNVNVRAGPDVVFPVVTWLYSQDTVMIQGCLADFSWCDIQSGRTRGWVNASYLRNVFRNRTPVVTFSVESYWDAHYRTRGFFADKAAWAGWGTPGFTPPPQQRRRARA